VNRYGKIDHLLIVYQNAVQAHKVVKIKKIRISTNFFFL